MERDGGDKGQGKPQPGWWGSRGRELPLVCLCAPGCSNSLLGLLFRFFSALGGANLPCVTVYAMFLPLEALPGGGARNPGA